MPLKKVFPQGVRKASSKPGRLHVTRLKTTRIKSNRTGKAGPTGMLPPGMTSMGY